MKQETSAKMKKLSPLIGIICVFSIVIVVSLIVSGIIVSHKYSYDYKNDAYMFNSIDDLRYLDEKMAEIDLKDKFLDNLSYVAAKTIRVNFNGKDFDVYAYEFATANDAIKYAERVSGKNISKSLEYIGKENLRFGSSFGILYTKVKSSMGIISDNKVLRYEVRNVSHKKEFEFTQWLMLNLPQKIELPF